MPHIENHDIDIDCELLLRLWKDSGIVSVKKNGIRMQKWEQIARSYNSKKAPSDPLDVRALQNKWHGMITGRGGSKLSFLQSGDALGATELRNEPTPLLVRAINKDIDRQQEHEPQPSSLCSAPDSVATKPTTKDLKTAVDVRQRRTQASPGNEPRKRQKTTDDDVIVQDCVHPEKDLREISEMRKEVLKKESLLNETLLKAAEAELEGKREFWKTKNEIAREELEKATAEKEAALADRITALLNRNVAIANYNLSNRKKITLPSPPDME